MTEMFWYTWCWHCWKLRNWEICDTSLALSLHTCSLTQSKPWPNSKPPGAGTNKNKYAVLKAVTVHTQVLECLSPKAHTFIHNTSLCRAQVVHHHEYRRSSLPIRASGRRRHIVAAWIHPNPFSWMFILKCSSLSSSSSLSKWNMERM